MDAATLGTSYHSATPIHKTAVASFRDWRTTILQDSPTIFMRYGEAAGVTAFDISGNSNNGTYNGGVALGATGAIPTDGDKGDLRWRERYCLVAKHRAVLHVVQRQGMIIQTSRRHPPRRDVFSAFSALSPIRRFISA